MRQRYTGSWCTKRYCGSQSADGSICSSAGCARSSNVGKPGRSLTCRGWVGEGVGLGCLRRGAAGRHRQSGGRRYEHVSSDNSDYPALLSARTPSLGLVKHPPDTLTQARSAPTLSPSMLESGTWNTQVSSRDTPRSTSESVWGVGRRVGERGDEARRAREASPKPQHSCHLFHPAAAVDLFLTKPISFVPCTRGNSVHETGNSYAAPPTLILLRGAIISSVVISRLERFSRASAASNLPGAEEAYCRE
jgi:hypothetical protein